MIDRVILDCFEETGWNNHGYWVNYVAINKVVNEKLKSLNRPLKKGSAIERRVRLLAQHGFFVSDRRGNFKRLLSDSKTKQTKKTSFIPQKMNELKGSFAPFSAYSVNKKKTLGVDKMSLNYSKESESIGESNWFRPKVGRYKVKFLSELSDKYETNIGEKTIEQVKARIETNGDVFDWSMGIAFSPASLFGQLVLLGKEWGSLKDKEINLIVTSDNKKNTYTIEEAVDLQSTFVKKAEA